MYKQLMMLFMFLMVVSSVFSLEHSISATEQRVNVILRSERGEQTTNFSQTYAFPTKDAEIIINKMIINKFDNEGNFVDTTDEIDYSRVRVINSFIFREMNGFTINVNLQNDNSKIVELDFDVVGRGEVSIPETISEAFLPLYKTLADNFDTSYLRGLPFSKPIMLIINHASLNGISADYYSWKKSLGYELEIANFSDIGSNFDDLKSFVENRYNETKFDYLVLMGDVDGQYAIPGGYKTSPSGEETDVTDHPYAMIMGDDYFPEIFVGRISFDLPTELYTILNKTIKYEREPYMENTAWMTKALIVAGNYTDTGSHPVTPVWSSKWLMRELYQEGFSQVDTLFSYNGDASGASFIQGTLNNGVQYVTYRGWGDANGWHYPQFHKNELAQTSNSGMTPIVTSIVCNTGDFANVYQDPCFGEKWLRMGEPNAINGCVAFIGPTNLHTHTNLNNSIYSGIWKGILDEGIQNIGPALIRGKMEVYNNFPNNRNFGDDVDFWFHTYNLLGDPSLRSWKLVPQAMNVNLPTSIDDATSSLEITLPGMDGAIITSTKDNETYKFTRVENGYAIIPIDNTVEGNVTITISKQNYLPFIQEIEVEDSENIGMVSYSFSGDGLVVGQNNTLNIELKNYGTTSQNVVATLSSDVMNDDVEVDFGTIDSNSSSSRTFTVFCENLEHNENVEFTLSLSTGETIKFEAQAIGLNLVVSDVVVNDALDYLVPSSTNNVSATLIKQNDYAQVTSVHIHPLTDAVVVSNINITTNENVVVDFDATVQNGTYNGRVCRFKFTFESQETSSQTLYRDLVVGEVSTTDPTPAAYNSYPYFAYDSNDVGYDARPEYNWIEIDPELGGNGTSVNVSDDDVITIDLPFNFGYFGNEYNQLTACSNGWIAFDETIEWMANFRNWDIPSALGPNAMVAVYWDDLKGYEVEQGEFADMRIVYFYDEANNRFIIEWCDTYNQENTTLLEKFEVILEPIENEDGDITIMFNSVHNPDVDGNYATVGIENYEQNDGLLYTFGDYYPASASPLEDGLAIKFTKTAPDSYTPNIGDEITPVDFVVNQNYPNPFNPKTTISFTIPNDSDVSVEVYNILGQKVKTLLNKHLTKGNHKVQWFGKDESNNDVSSGIYFYKVRTSSKEEMKKMILLK